MIIDEANVSRPIKIMAALILIRSAIMPVRIAPMA